MSPSFVDRTQLPGIMVGIFLVFNWFLQHSANSVWILTYSWSSLGFGGYVHLVMSENTCYRDTASQNLVLGCGGLSPDISHQHRVRTTTTTRARTLKRWNSSVDRRFLCLADGRHGGRPRWRCEAAPGATTHAVLAPRTPERREALAAAQHHSAPKSAGPVTYDAQRGQNTAEGGRRPVHQALFQVMQKVRCGAIELEVPKDHEAVKE